MNFKTLDAYLLSQKGATYDYPFDAYVRVYRVCGKIFALINEQNKPIAITPIQLISATPMLFNLLPKSYHKALHKVFESKT
jgi:predicted DNA-binding protein (MmcQ/YjbR family)